MDHILDMLNSGDLCWVVILVVILLFIGGKMVTGRPVSHAWGMRLAALAFVAYGVYGCITTQPLHAEDLVGIAVRGLLAAGLTLGVAWVSLPILAFLYDHSLGALLRRSHTWFASARMAADERQRRRDEARRQEQARREWERSAPERERQRRDSEALAQVRAGEQRRREIARANCQVLYALYAADIGERFPKSMLDEFLKTYMDDSRTADFVEERAQQLQTLLRQHHETVRPPPKFRSLQEITNWFQGQLTEIATLPIEDRIKRTLIAVTNRQQAEAITEFLNRSRVP